jgi:hypothetical protein
MTRQTPEFLEHYAKVLEREADARPQWPAFAADLRQWAANARRRAAEIPVEPVQGDLFA